MVPKMVTLNHIAMIKHTILILFTALSFIATAQDTLIDYNGYMYIGKITEKSEKEIAISYLDHKKIEQIEKIKIKRLSYCTDTSLKFEKQSIVTSTKSYKVKSENIYNLLDDEVIKNKTWIEPFDPSNILPIEHGSVLYSKVVPVKDISADELFKRAHLWFVNSFRSANEVLQMNDKKAGILIGKGNMEYYIKVKKSPINYSGRIRFTLSVYVKDGRYKYEISSIYVENDGRYSSESAIESYVNANYSIINDKAMYRYTREFHYKLFKHIDKKIDLMITDLMLAMMKTQPTSDTL